MSTLTNIRSYVRRAGRLSVSQRYALENLTAKYYLDPKQKLDKDFFENKTVILEIGFGMGESFLKMAEKFPEWFFIGAEVHTPGVAQVMHVAESKALHNIRLFHADIVTVLQDAIPENAIDKCQIFFPDPWHKRRHHKRRLINDYFLKLLSNILRKEAVIHIATDWDHYAKEINALMDKYFNPVDPQNNPLCERLSTKYERRGSRLGHTITDLFYQLSLSSNL